MAPGSGQEPDAEDRALLDAGLTQFDLDELRTEFFLPNTTIQHYINSFRKYDKDGSGDIDLDELSQLLHDVGIKLPEADVDDMMSIVDTDGGGTVGLSEFIYLMADPDGPLAKAINGQDGLVDPRQARLKRGYKEVQRKRRDLFASRRVRLQGRLRCRNPGFPADSNVGRRGWAGCVGVGAVSCSEELPDIVPKARFARSHDGLLVAAADGGGRVVIFRRRPTWEHARVKEKSDSVGTDSAVSDPAAARAWMHQQQSVLLPSVTKSEGFRDRSADFELVAVLQHLNRVRCLAWSTRIEAPVLACGGSDGRVCAWRPLGEGRLRIKLSAAFLRRVKQGKEEVYAVLSLGRQFYITPDADIEREVSWEGEGDHEFEFECYSAMERLSIILYVKDKDMQKESRRQAKLDEESDGISRTASENAALDRERAAAEAEAAKKEKLVGKGAVGARIGDRVTVSKSFVNDHWVDPSGGRVGTITALHTGCLEATVEWDVSPSDNTGKRGFGFGMRQSVDEEMNHQVEISKTGKTQREATEHAQGEKVAAESPSSPNSSENEQSEFVRDSSMVEEIPPKTFPSATPGTLPIGLGSSGRVGDGRQVFALALHSRAISRASMHVLNLARLTELSENGEGGWIETEAIVHHEKKDHGRSLGEDMESQANISANEKAELPRYSGRLKVRSSWVRYPGIWERISVSGDTERPERHEDEVTGVMFCARPDGEAQLISCSLDKRCKFWDLMWESDVTLNPSMLLDVEGVQRGVSQRLQTIFAGSAQASDEAETEDTRLAAKLANIEKLKSGGGPGLLRRASSKGVLERKGSSASLDRKGSISVLERKDSIPALDRTQSISGSGDVGKGEAGADKQRLTDAYSSSSAAAKSSVMEFNGSPAARAETTTSEQEETVDNEDSDGVEETAKNGTPGSEQIFENDEERVASQLRKRVLAEEKLETRWADLRLQAQRGTHLQAGELVCLMELQGLQTTLPSHVAWRGGCIRFAAMGASEEPEDEYAIRKRPSFSKAAKVARILTHFKEEDEDPGPLQGSGFGRQPSVLKRLDSSQRMLRIPSISEHEEHTADHDAGSSASLAAGKEKETERRHKKEKHGKVKKHEAAGRHAGMFRQATHGELLPGEEDTANQRKIEKLIRAPSLLQRSDSMKKEPRTAVPALLRSGSGKLSFKAAIQKVRKVTSLLTLMKSGLAQKAGLDKEDPVTADGAMDSASRLPHMLYLMGDDGDVHCFRHRKPKDLEAVTARWDFVAKIDNAAGWPGAADVHFGWPPIAVCPNDMAMVAIACETSVELWNMFESSRDHRIEWIQYASLKEHLDSVRAICWRSDSRLVASADRSGEVKIWARGSDEGVWKVQRDSCGSGGWLCVQTIAVKADPEFLVDGAGGTGDIELYSASPLGQREELSEDDEERVESPPLDGASLPSALDHIANSSETAQRDSTVSFKRGSRRGSNAPTRVSAAVSGKSAGENLDRSTASHAQAGSSAGVGATSRLVDADSRQIKLGASGAPDDNFSGFIREDGAVPWDGTQGDVQCLTFGVGPLRDVLFVGAHDQSLYMYDTAGLCTRQPNSRRR